MVLLLGWIFSYLLEVESKRKVSSRPPSKEKVAKLKLCSLSSLSVDESVRVCISLSVVESLVCVIPCSSSLLALCVYKSVRV